MKLAEIMSVVVNNEACVVLKINEFEDPKRLIALGYFSGCETMIRVTKGSVPCITIFESRTRYSQSISTWETGVENNPEESHHQRMCAKIILDCIQNDFGLSLANEKDLIEQLNEQLSG